MKKIAYRFIIRANAEDIITATDLNLRENTNPEKKEAILEEFLRDFRNWEIDCYYEKWYIVDEDFEVIN